MRTVMTALLVAASTMLTTSACRTAPSTAPMTSLPENVKWVDSPNLPGVKNAVLAGNPSQPGPFTVRGWFPANYQVPAHSHPYDENITVISGALYQSLGDRLDKSKGTRYGPGEFFRLPANTRHSVWCTEETVFQLHGVGPTGTTWVNPADKPGKM